MRPGRGCAGQLGLKPDEWPPYYTDWKQIHRKTVERDLGAVSLLVHSPVLAATAPIWRGTHRPAAVLQDRTQGHSSQETPPTETERACQHFSSIMFKLSRYQL